MSFHDLFNITLIMTLRRTLLLCALAALFFIVAASLYDASALVDRPVRAWMGLQ
jgi:hypothetical protein